MNKPVASTASGVVADFVGRVQTHDYAGHPIYIGIDPGSTGAIAFLCRRLCRVIDIPVDVIKSSRSKKTTAKEFKATGKKSKTVIGTTTLPNFAGICQLFNRLKDLKPRIIVTLEQAPITTGPGKHHGDVILNRAWAMWPLFLYSRAYEVENVTPVIWKTKMGLRGKEKKDSLLKARTLFPQAELHMAQHADRAEAILMAEYTRRQRTLK